MHRTKTIAIIVALVLIIPLSIMHIKTIQLRSSASVEIGVSEDHESEELLKAADVVKKHFTSRYYKRIIKIRYDESVSREYVDDYNEEHGMKLKYHDTILLLCDYETNADALQIAAKPNATYTDRQFILVRKGEGNSWEIIDTGEA